MGSFCVFLISLIRTNGDYELSGRVGLSADLPTKACPKTDPPYEEQTRSRPARVVSCRRRNISGFMRVCSHTVRPFIDRWTGVLCVESVCFCGG